VTGPTTARVDACEVDGFDAVVLRAGALEATVVPGAGMIGVSLRHHGDELLAAPVRPRDYAERRGLLGIPLLHPWANRLSDDEYAIGDRRVRLPAGSDRFMRDDNGLPIHGLLSGSPHWDAVRAQETQDGGRLTAQLDFGAHPELLEAFPFPHRLEVRYGLEPSRLTVATAVEATSDAGVVLSFGWHPYLRLPGVRRTDWHVVLPAMRRLVADERNIPTGETCEFEGSDGPLGDRTFDTGFEDVPEGAVFELAGGRSRVAVVFVRGYPVAQVFAPPGEDLICFEPMAAPTDALRSGRGLRALAPGRRFEAVFEIRVTDG
jgi:aldose 1-epimerase